MQEFTAPVATSYKIQCWGAQGGGYGSHSNGPGGYSGGWRNVSKGQILYVVCGGKGIDKNHYTDGTSYNGGGINISVGQNGNGAGGGGATHIATATGLLRELVDKKSTVICVAGGAGATGGWASQNQVYWLSGGGEVGLGSNPTIQSGAATTKGDTGGTQTGCGPDGIKGGFGYGGNAGGSGGAGGGGWYGGNGSGGNGVSDNTNGGGGSGYIGGLTNATTIDGGKTFPRPGGGTEQGHFGHGYAIISWISPSL